MIELSTSEIDQVIHRVWPSVYRIHGLFAAPIVIKISSDRWIIGLFVQDGSGHALVSISNQMMVDRTGVSVSDFLRLRQENTAIRDRASRFTDEVRHFEGLLTLRLPPFQSICDFHKACPIQFISLGPASKSAIPERSIVEKAIHNDWVLTVTHMEQ